MSFRPNAIERYIEPDGRLTIDGLKVFQGMFDRVSSLEEKMTAISEITAPTGGATIDAEARAAINNIISGAG